MRTAADTFEQIADGGRMMMALALMRLDEAKNAVQEGRFTDARRHAGEALHKVNMLAEAQAGLGIFGATTAIIRAGDVEEGTYILDWGRVSKIERKRVDHALGGPTEQVLIYLEDEEDVPRELPAVSELLIGVDDGA